MPCVRVDTTIHLISFRTQAAQRILMVEQNLNVIAG
jgi:hypothetical protein